MGGMQGGLYPGTGRPSPPMGMGAGALPMGPAPPAPPPMPAPAGSLGPPQANPGAMLNAAGMQASPTNAPMPARPGDMMNPTAPSQESPEVTTPMGQRMLQQALPGFNRTPLGALLIPGLINGR